jgi:hypothetical protein
MKIPPFNYFTIPITHPIAIPVNNIAIKTIPNIAMPNM